MKASLLRRLTALTLVVAGLVVGSLGSATAAPRAAVPAVPTIFSLSGTYTDGGSVRPVINAPTGSTTFTVNIVGRQTATGTVRMDNLISVNFPDAGTFVGTLVAPGSINWSNGSGWTKLTQHPPNIIGLSETDARAAIRAAGLVVGSVTFRIDRTCSHDDTVISQNPNASEFVLPGDRVNIVIGVCP